MDEDSYFDRYFNYYSHYRRGNLFQHLIILSARFNYLACTFMCILTLTSACAKEVKQYEHGKLVYEGTVDNNGMREEGKLYDPVTGRIIFDGLFKNNLMFKGTIYDKKGKNSHPYEE